MFQKIGAAFRRTYQDCARVLASLGLVDFKGPGVRGCPGAEVAQSRMDANETMWFARQLEHIKTTLVEDAYPANRGKALIPEETGVNPGAQSFTWRRMSRVGTFKFLSARNATDLPKVDVYASETTTPIRVLVGSYDWTTEDIRNSVMAGMPLSATKARVARETYEQTVDHVIAVGDSARGIPGALVDSSVPLIVAGINGDWQGAATSQEMLDDMHAIANATWNQALQTSVPDTLVLPPALFSIVSTKRMSDFDATTVLEAFLKASTMIKNVTYWLECENAAANGTDDRAFCYRRAPTVLGYVEPLKFQSQPPQAKGVSFLVPCEGKTGGTVIYQPYNCSYCDVLN